MNRRRLYVRLLSATALLAPAAARAQGFLQRVGEGVNSAAVPAGFQSEITLPQIIGNVIGAVLSLLGIVLLGLLIYAGFLWMTAGGEKGKIEKAQGMIRNAIVGLVIIAASYAISTFVLSSLYEATTGDGGV